MVEASRTPSALDPSRPAGTAPRGFTRYAWFVLAYLLCVILFGAWVRITGSGAGCGSHWPTCRGEVLPRNPDAEMLIEFTHRATSGLLGLLVLGLVAFAYSTQPHRGRVLRATLVTLLFTLVEAAIGAKLVLAELVKNDASVARAVVIVIHLGSTFTLTAATALAAFWSARTTPVTLSQSARIKWLFALSLAAVIVVGMTGAVTALGDTLFPVSPTEGEGVLSHLKGDLDDASHFLVRLRIVHPVLAVLVSGWLLSLPVYLSAQVGRTAARLLGALRLLVLFQAGIGVANIALGAPGGFQLAHLLGAQAVWLVLVLAFAASLEEPGGRADAPR